MSQLAFDKEGQPFQFLAQTESLWVRRFRNPGARGTCEVLYDEEDDLLHVDADATLAELRQAVGQVPGLYRLDQCDETAAVIDKAPPAYVTIDPPRNGLLPGGAADPLAIVRDMAAINADVSKTLADRAAGMMEAMAGCMRDMRAALGGEANHRLLALMTKVTSEQDDEDEGDEDDDREDDEEPAPPEPPDPLASLGPLAPMVAAMAPKIGEAIAAKVIELMTQFSKAPPAAATASTKATAPAPASAPTPSGATSDGAAAGPSSAGDSRATAPPPPASGSPAPSAATEPPTAAAAPIPAQVAATAATEGSSAPAATSTTPATGPGVRNGVPSAEQLAHLLSVRAALTSREAAIVDGVIARMDGSTGARWIAELSAMTVDQAVERVRSLIPKPKRGDAREE